MGVSLSRQNAPEINFLFGNGFIYPIKNRHKSLYNAIYDGIKTYNCVGFSACSSQKSKGKYNIMVVFRCSVYNGGGCFYIGFALLRVSVALLRSIIHRLYNSVVYRLRFYGGIAPDAIGKADSSTNGNR